MENNLQFVRTYYIRGAAPRSLKGRYGISDPPTSGWSHAVLLPGDKRSTLLCPFTLHSYQIHNDCLEVSGAVPISFNAEALAGRITECWERMVGFGFQRSYDVAAVALTRLGAPVPRILPTQAEGSEQRRTGGKEVDEATLRPVRQASKRGRVAEFFLSDEPQSLREAMAVLGLSRSGVLSHLYCLNRDHGVGYELAADCARLLVPDGFDLFAVPDVSPGPTETSGAAGNSDRSAGPLGRKPAGKPLDEARISAVPEPSKRATVAKEFLDWADLGQAQEKLDLSRSAILSHLFTINKDHGLGYEVSEDGKTARLVYPEGHVVFGPKPKRQRKPRARETAAEEIRDDEDWLN